MMAIWWWKKWVKGKNWTVQSEGARYIRSG